MIGARNFCPPAWRRGNCDRQMDRSTRRSTVIGATMVVATVPVSDLERAKALYGGIESTHTAPVAARYPAGPRPNHQVSAPLPRFLTPTGGADRGQLGRRRRCSIHQTFWGLHPSSAMIVLGGWAAPGCP